MARKKKYPTEQLWEMRPTEVYELVVKEEIKRFPNHYWTAEGWEDRVCCIVKYILEEKLKLTEADIKEQWSFNLLREWRLYGMLNVIFKNHPFDVLEFVYPNRFNIWEFRKVENGYWTIETGTRAIRWLIEEKLQLTDDELRECWSFQFLTDYNLHKAVEQVFSNNLYETINTTYPNKFKPWEFKCAPREFWTLETGIESIKWLIEEKLQLSEEELLAVWGQSFLNEHGLRGMLQQVFGNNTYTAINTVYPNRFKEWQFKSVPKSFWTPETLKEAIRWLVEEKLQLTDDEIKEQWSYQLLKEHGLASAVIMTFRGRVFDALDSVYPGRFKAWDFKNVPRRYWTRETSIEATQWLLTEQLKLSAEEIKNMTTANVFREYRLMGPILFFNGKTRELLQASYPELMSA